MAEVVDWLRRLDALVQPDSTTHFARYRVAGASPIDFDDSVIRVDDTKRRVETFGAVPVNLSILTFLDTGGQHPYRDQLLATQLGAVLTLATGRRVRVAAGEMTLGMEGSEKVTFLPSTINGRDLLGPIEVDPKSKTEQLLKQLAGLNSDEAEVIVAALDLHYAATQLYDVDLNTAYTLVVAGIETLSSAFEPRSTDWESFPEASRWEATFDRLGVDQGLRSQLRAELLEGKQLRLRQRFASYALRRLEPGFWRLAVRDFVPSVAVTPRRSDFEGMTEAAPIPMEHLVPKDSETLRRRLLASYDARSKFVHTGTRGVDEDSAFLARSGRPMSRKDPLDFTGLRRILEWLLKKEIEERTTESPLPEVRLIRTRTRDAEFDARAAPRTAQV